MVELWGCGWVGGGLRYQLPGEGKASAALNPAPARRFPGGCWPGLGTALVAALGVCGCAGVGVGVPLSGLPREAGCPLWGGIWGFGGSRSISSREGIGAVICLCVSKEVNVCWGNALCLLKKSMPNSLFLPAPPPPKPQQNEGKRKKTIGQLNLNRPKKGKHDLLMYKIAT